MDKYHILTFQGNYTGGQSDDDKEDDGSSVMFPFLEAGCKHPHDQLHVKETAESSSEVSLHNNLASGAACGKIQQVFQETTDSSLLTI